MKILLIIGLWYLGIGCGIAVLYHAFMMLVLLIGKQLVEKDESLDDKYTHFIKLRDETLTIQNVFYIIFVWPSLIIYIIKLFNRREGI